MLKNGLLSIFYPLGYTTGLENLKIFICPNYRKDGEDEKLPLEFELLLVQS